MIGIGCLSVEFRKIVTIIMIQISGQYCRKDFEFPRFLSFACIHWKSAGFYNFQSTHDCHKWPEPVVKFQSFMIATSVIYLLENHKLLHNSTIIPCTIVRSNMYPSRNRRISHTFTRLWLSQSACIRRKRQDFANPVPFTVTHTARVREKMSDYVHFVSVTIVVLLGGLCPSGNHCVSHILTLSQLI